MRTPIFKTGYSQAVCIPRELAFADDVKEVEIERVGNTLVLRPVQSRTLADLGELLAMFSPHFMAEGREALDEVERDWSVPAPGSPAADRG
jgi:antitoxin VapB